MTKLFKLWLPIFIWGALIYHFSSIPYLTTDLKCDFLLRKIAHLIEYFVPTFLIYRALRGSFKINFTGLLLYSSILPFLFAISDEFHQSFIPGRYSTVRDVLIDTIGIVSCLLFISLLERETE